MAERLTPDICVIGAGSGGLTVAAAAAAFGVSVVLIEKGQMGGDCLNYGCVPSKALIAAATHVRAIREASAFGVIAGEPDVDFRKVQDHVHAVIAAIAPNDSVERFTAMGVKVIREEAAFVNDRTVRAGAFEIAARRFVVATGSSPLVPRIDGLDEIDYLTNETVFDLTRRPEHLVAIGAGPVGLELAQAFRRLGSAVTVIEAERALGRDDPELAAIVLKQLCAEGVRLLDQAAVSRLERHGTAGVRLRYEQDGKTGSVTGSDLLLAVGRSANVEGLGLEKAGIAHDREGIKTDRRMRTTNRRVFAVGDVVAGGYRFTHVAGYQAGLVVQQILFRAPARENPGIIPWVTYTDPELAHVGLKEDEARQRHRGVRALRWPLADNDRAQTERRTAGMIKLVTDARGRILGATVVGPNAGEIINMWSLALANGMSVGDVRGYIPPYPTMGEIGKRAVLSYYGDIPRKRLVRGLSRLLRWFG